MVAISYYNRVVICFVTTSVVIRFVTTTVLLFVLSVEIKIKGCVRKKSFNLLHEGTIKKQSRQGRRNNQTAKDARLDAHACISHRKKYA